VAIIELKDVKYEYKSRYQRVEALKGINFSFEEGSCCAIVGKSGSGKSTLLSLIAGLALPSSGQVLYKGKPTSEIGLTKYRRNEAAMIYQSFRLFPLLTAEENVAYTMELRGVGAKQARIRARELISRVALPESVFNRLPGMLSGGEQQRVAIARALSMGSRLLLCDEPTGNLDQENSDLIIETLIGLARREGYCVIIATHDLSITDKMDVTCRMSGGVLV